MSYNTGKSTPELWAVVDDNGNVQWTRGGSSTAPRLMVYESEAKAFRSLASPWIKQLWTTDYCPFHVRKIYPAASDCIGKPLEELPYDALVVYRLESPPREDPERLGYRDDHDHPPIGEK